MNGVQSPPGEKRVAVDPESGPASSPAYIPQSWIDSLLDRLCKTVKLTREERLIASLRRDERHDKPRDDSPS